MCTPSASKTPDWSCMGIRLSSTPIGRSSFLIKTFGVAVTRPSLTRDSIWPSASIRLRAAFPACPEARFGRAPLGSSNDRDTRGLRPARKTRINFAAPSKAERTPRPVAWNCPRWSVMQVTRKSYRRDAFRTYCGVPRLTSGRCCLGGRMPSRTAQLAAKFHRRLFDPMVRTPRHRERKHQDQQQNRR